jgi:hypothetical protein
MYSFSKFISEATTPKRVTIWTNPRYLGADIHRDDHDDLSTEDIEMGSIQGIEPAEKMKDPSSNKNMKNIASAITSGKGNTIPPILVMRDKNKGYKILDGHHRYHAHKLANVTHIRAKVVPEEQIEYRDDVPEETPKN